MSARNPFVFSGPLDPEQMVDRDWETDELATLAAGGHWIRLEAPRRYGKTTLLRRVLAEAERSGRVSTLVDLEGVLSLGGIVIRIERAYSRSLKGKARQAVDRLFRSWDSALPTNEQRVAMALALSPGQPGDADVRARVGIGRGSVHAATRQLRGRGDVIDTSDGPRLTDPLLELWLRERMEP